MTDRQNKNFFAQYNAGRKERLLEKTRKNLLAEMAQRAEIEAELAQSEEQFRTLVENIPGAVFRCDAHPPWPVHYVSERIFTICGYPAALFLQEETSPDFKSIVFPEDWPWVEPFLRENVSAGKPFDLEYRIRHADGTIRWVHQTNSVVFNQEGKQQFLDGVVFDITERKSIEQKLKKKNQESGSLSAELSETNAALKVLLKKREEDQRELKRNVVANVKELVEPYLEKLAAMQLGSQQTTFVEIIRHNLENVVSPYLSSVSSYHHPLTASEMQVADLIRQGKSTKEIGALLNLSPRTIESHRKRIRRKLGLQGRRIDLRTYLLSL